MLGFIRELAEYEREPASAVATEADLLRDGFGATPRFHCLIATWSEQTTESEQRTTQEPAGFALYFYNYSTWRGHTGIYVEDLFVRPAFRGRGIGKALLASVAAIAHRQGCPRLEWAVLDWNTLAIDFYRTIGAEALSEWTIMRISGDALRQLAQSSGS
jgi:GNAT superfamily N-acetyltransferase